MEAAGAGAALPLRADATKDDEVAGAFEEIEATWGEVHALVNAVGPSGAGRFEDLSDEDWLRVFDQGALTAVRCIRHALPLLRRAEWGRIVNITAVSVQHQSTGLIGYTASKAALASITKNLARSLAANGILVNAVAPGPVLTGPIQAAVERHTVTPATSTTPIGSCRNATAPQWISNASPIRPRSPRWSPSAPRRRTPT